MDSSAWISYLMDEPTADEIGQWLSRDEQIVPTIVVYEVCKWMRREVSSRASRAVAARMRQHTIVPLDEFIARAAGMTSLDLGLAMADAIIYTTAQLHDATLVTGDAHFDGLPGVEYIPAASIEPPGTDG